jgi:hypothetical protein
MARLPPGAPYAPAQYTDADVRAIQALDRGEALPDQQVRALEYLVEELCKTYDLSYRPSGDRDTAFAEGRRFVGLQIVKITKLKLEALKEKDHGRRSTSSRRDPDRQPAAELRAAGGRPISDAGTNTGRHEDV